MLAPLVLAALVAAPTTFRIDAAHAGAGFELDATLHTVHGKTSGVSGQVAATPAPDGSLTFEGKIEIDAKSIVTGNDRRDATMHDSCLDVARHPSFLLEPESFVPSAAAPGGGSVAGTIKGRLTIRGVTRPTTIAATLTPAGDGIDTEGTFDVAWADYKIPDPSFLFVRLKPVLHAHFFARFVPAP